MEAAGEVSLERRQPEPGCRSQWGAPPQGCGLEPDGQREEVGLELVVPRVCFQGWRGGENLVVGKFHGEAVKALGPVGFGGLFF